VRTYGREQLGTLKKGSGEIPSRGYLIQNRKIKEEALLLPEREKTK